MAWTEIRRVSCVPRTKATLESSLKSRAVAYMKWEHPISYLVGPWVISHLPCQKGRPTMSNSLICVTELSFSIQFSSINAGYYLIVTMVIFKSSPTLMLFLFSLGMNDCIQGHIQILSPPIIALPRYRSVLLVPYKPVRLLSSTLSVPKYLSSLMCVPQV